MPSAGVVGSNPAGRATSLLSGSSQHGRWGSPISLLEGHLPDLLCRKAPSTWVRSDTSLAVGQGGQHDTRCAVQLPMSMSVDCPRALCALPTRRDKAAVHRLPRWGWAVALVLLLQACTSNGAVEGHPTAPSVPSVTADWYDVVSHQPGPAVADPAMRRKIEASRQPWKVRDRATGIEMVLVMPGEFLMGSPESEAGRQRNEGQQHLVRLTRAFYLGATEVTQEQWQSAMGPTPSFFEGDDRPIDPSWNDVQAFLAKANDGTAAEADRLRLPTEAEWEYACRAGTAGQFSFEGSLNHSLVNFNDGVVGSAVVVDGRLEVEWATPPAPECRMTTANAGSLPPNPWGLHEMHGNLWEWTDERYSADGYPEGEAVDPFTRAVGDELRTLRGGSWYDRGVLCRSAVRDAGGPSTRSNRIGFRVARTL